MIKLSGFASSARMTIKACCYRQPLLYKYSTGVAYSSCTKLKYFCSSNVCECCEHNWCLPVLYAPWKQAFSLLDLHTTSLICCINLFLFHVRFETLIRREKSTSNLFIVYRVLFCFFVFCGLEYMEVYATWFQSGSPHSVIMTVEKFNVKHADQTQDSLK